MWSAMEKEEKKKTVTFVTLVDKFTCGGRFRDVKDGVEFAS